jgi:predicted Ser/Thr protein kinase
MDSRADTHSLSDSTERALTEVLAGLDAGEDLEQLLSAWPHKASALREKVRAARDDETLVFVPPTPPQISGYRIDRILGRGGMGEVWLAQRESDDLVVALKLVRDASLTPERRVRIRREAEALRALQHPGIVRVHDAGENAEGPWIAMDYVPGRSLTDILADAKVELRERIAIFRDVARALGTAHAAGIVHRDIKPQNIIVRDDGRAVLIDFGLTRGLEPSSLSRTGGFVGTPHYAAPEQVRGERDTVGPASDVFSFGVSLYEAVVGRRPFEASTVESLFYQILTADPLSLRSLDGSLPRDLETVVNRAIEKKPRDRYPTAAELADDLDALLALRPVQARPYAWRRRMARRARRHPRQAALILALALVVAVVATLAFAREVTSRRAARHEIERGQALLMEWQENARGLTDRIGAFEERQRVFERSYRSPDELRDFNREERALDLALRERERIFAEVDDALRRAGDLHRNPAGADALRASLDVERWRAAQSRGHEATARHFAKRVRSNRAAGSLKRVVAGTRPLWLEVEPAGARVDAFFLRRQDRLRPEGEPRLVPVPIRGDDDADIFSGPPRAGDLVLVVRRGAGELLAGDLILEWNGHPPRVEDRGGAPGVEVCAWRNGKTFRTTTAAGLILRPSAAPLRHGPASFVGEAPLEGVEIAADQFLLLVRAEGYEPLRLTRPAWETSREHPLRVRLVPCGRHPAAFRQVVLGSKSQIFISDRELTLGEFRRFLDSATGRQALVEGEIDPPAEWTQDDAGRWHPQRSQDPWAPAHGLSWRTARAYVAWANQELAESGKPYRFRLPNAGMLQQATRLDDMMRRFPWGDQFRASFAKSCFSGPEPSVEAVLSYPVDETSLGLFDVAGSVAELAAGWFWEEEGERPVCGGAWVYARPIHFELEFMGGCHETAARSFYGLRLELVDPSWVH